MDHNSGSTRQTNNSLSASFFVPTSAVSVSPSTPFTSVVSSVAASVAMSVSPLTSEFTLTPAFVAAVATVVQAALTPQASSSGIIRLFPAQEPGACLVWRTCRLHLGAFPFRLPALSIVQHCSWLLQSHHSVSKQVFSLCSIPQGRPMISVPSLISTLVTPRSAISSSAIAMGASRSVLSSYSSPNLGLPLSFQQQFVLPPGFTSVPAKTVNQILAGKYIDLGDLLSANILEKEPEWQVYFGGNLVITPSAKKHCRKVDDIVSWSEAFSVFTLILTSYFPHSWKDLMCYKLLILQKHRHLSGRVWRSKDTAFRQHAAATKQVDWSNMNSELFNFHAAGASLRPGASAASLDVPEPSGAPSSQIICRSWNRGRCSSQYSYCRYAHRCSICAGSHRSSDCAARTESASTGERKRASSPPPVSASSSKARRHWEANLWHFPGLHCGLILFTHRRTVILYLSYRCHFACFQSRLGYHGPSAFILCFAIAHSGGIRPSPSVFHHMTIA